MKRSPQARGSLLCVAAACGVLSLFIARAAHADPSYPDKMRAALDEIDPTGKHCVPQCTVCHRTAEGGAGTSNLFGSHMVTIGGLGRNGDTDEAGMKDALNKLLAAATDSDGDGDGDVIELEAGNSPAIAGDAGKDQVCSDIAYGCGAHIARSAPVDQLGFFSAGLVGLGLLMARRRRVAR